MATNKYWTKLHSEIDAYIKARDAYYGVIVIRAFIQDAINQIEGVQ